MRNHQLPNSAILLISIFCIFWSTVTWADPLPPSPIKNTTKNFSLLHEGILKLTENGYYLQQLENNTLLHLNFENTSQELIFQRLNNGDFISIQAVKINSTEILFNSINYIGLASILGIWLGDDNVCYYFKSFSSFYIYNTDTNGGCSVPTKLDSKKSRRMSYFITPDDVSWFILISDKTTQYAAELILKNSKTIQINLFDDQTGDILSKVILRR